MVTRKNTEISWKKRRDIAFAILGWMLIIGIVFWLLGHIGRSLLLIIIAAFLAYALFPAVKLLERYIPRLLAIIIIYLLVLMGIGIIVYTITSTAIHQFILLAHTINRLLLPKNHGASPLLITLQNFGITSQDLSLLRQQVTSNAEDLTSSIVPFLQSIFSFIVDMLLVAVISIYFIIDGMRMIQWIRGNTPATHQSRLQFLLRTVDRIVGGYVRGQLLLATLIGVLVWIGMLVLGVPYAILLGVIAFILEFIPILGTFISGAFAVLLALTHGWGIAVIALVYFLIIHVIEGDIVGPRIVGKALGLHPLVSMIALLIGTELYGIIGALFASPIAGVGQAILVTLWTEWKTVHPEDFKETLKESKKSISLTSK